MNHVISRSLCGIALASLLACGGGGGGLSNDAPSVSMTASPVVIDYGKASTITWSSKNVHHLSASSFPVSAASVNGSFTDTPATDTTYSITGASAGGDQATASVTVHVKANAKKILVIADPANPASFQVAQFLQGLSTISLTVSKTLPSGFSADVLVIGSSAQVTPADRSKVTSFMASGGGVVLVGRAPCLLATGDTNNDDISAIGSFFAGATQCSFNLGVQNVVDSAPSGFPLCANVLGHELAGDDFITPVSAGAIRLATAGGSGSEAFAFRPTIGGKIAYTTAAPVDASANSVATRTVFLACVRWATK